MEQSGTIKGKVFLCGAGPGDPGLMTVKAMQLLKSVDVVLYDRLVGKQIVDQIPDSVQKQYVGRSVGDPAEHQEKTNELMVEHARRGLRVLRLKGGDPFVFGRGAEEAEFLRRRGIDFEVIPGVTSAIASPAYAGIPVTERHLSSSVAIVTGHEDEEKDGSSVKWEKLATSVDTIVVLMGTAQLSLICERLMAGGMVSDTPVAIVENGTSSRQRVVTGTLQSIESVARQAEIRPPAVIVIGKVVNMNSKIAWFRGGIDGPTDGK